MHLLSHFLAGFFLFSVSLLLIPFSFLGLFVAMVFSVLPDFDHLVGKRKNRFFHFAGVGILFSLPLIFFGMEFVLLGFSAFLLHLLCDFLYHKVLKKV